MTITQSSTRLVTAALGIAVAASLIVGAFAATTPARAAALTQTQIGAIVSLLQSFGADPATIANVQASLNGQATTGTGSTGSTGSTGGACPALGTVTLQQGSTGAAVKALQVFLNSSAATQVAASGAGSPGNETSTFGPATKAAVMKFQASHGVSAIGIVGPATRAAIVAVCGGGSTGSGGTPSVPISGNGLKVVLSPDSPNNVSLVQGQAAGTLAKFTFVNPTNAPIMVTNLSFKRIGVSNDTTMTNVYLYNGAVRLTDSAGVSNSAFNFNNPSGLFTVGANSTFTVSVNSDIAASSFGQQIGVQLVSVGASGTLDTGTSFPINGFTQSISNAILAAVDFNSTTLPSGGAVDPQADFTVWQNTASVNTRSVWFKSFALRNTGSIQNGDLRNFRLLVDGVQVGSAVSALDANNMVTFDLSANPVQLQTGGRVIKVLADVVGGASRTFDFSLRYPADALFVDSQLGQPVLPTQNGSAFSARTAGGTSLNSGAGVVSTINSITNSAPSVTRASDSPTQNVSVGATSVKWASFKLLASGEDVKIDNLNILAVTSNGAGLQNGAVFLNGVQVGSTKNLTNNTDVNFTFGSSLILKAGTVSTLDIFADAKGVNGTNLPGNTTATTSLDTGSQNGQGQVSLSSTNVPASIVTGNTITVASSALTATKFSGYGNQTLIAGSQNAKIGSFTLSAGSTEGINVNTIEIKFANAVSSTISDLTLKDPSNNNAIVGTPKSTVGTTNDFSVNGVVIPTSGTKTYDIYANIKTSANAGIIGGSNGVTVDVGTTGTGASTGNSVAVVTAPTLQNITIGSALLTSAVDNGATPDNANVIAGSSMVKVGSFKFTAQYSSFTVDKIAVKIPSGAATSVGSVILKYPDVNGAVQTATQALALPNSSQPYATSTFSGLTFYVPASNSANIDVYVSVPTVASGATSGAQISTLLSYNTGFNATDSAGNASTSIGSSDLNGAATTGKGVAVVRRSIPTLSAGPVINGGVLTAGTNNPIARVVMTADAAGDISWDKLVFTINKNTVTLIGATSTISLWNGSNQVAGTFATTTGANADIDTFGSSSTGGTLTFVPTSEQQIAAGGSATYELRGSVSGMTGAGVVNFVSISVANPDNLISSAKTDTAANVGNAVGLSTTSSFTWSDRSSISQVHSLTSSDWTNDYLIKTLPLNLGTLSITT